MAVSRRAWLRSASAGLAAGGLASAGCGRLGPELVIATSWTDDDLAPLAEAIAPARVAWVRPTEADDPTSLLRRGFAADAVIGGPAWSYERLASAGRLDPAAGVGPEVWVPVRSSPYGVALGPRARDISDPSHLGDLVAPDWAGRVALGDPRTDSIALGLMMAWLAAEPWSERYAALVRLAGQARPIAREPSAALAALVRGECDAVPTASHRVDHLAGAHFLPWPGIRPWLEGAALPLGTRNPMLARRLLDAAVSQASSAEPEEGPIDTDEPALAADLLGATLVEAQPELLVATRALRDSTRPEAADAARWMVEAPPWPPASVGVLRVREEGLALIDALLEQLLPEAESRAWLKVDWERPEAPLRGSDLNRLASAASGRLIAEPRFRAWLRVEWATWARQRYRRVERLAREGRGVVLRRPGGQRARGGGQSGLC